MSGTSKAGRTTSLDLAGMLSSTLFKRGSAGVVPSKHGHGKKARVEPIVDREHVSDLRGRLGSHERKSFHQVYASRVSHLNRSAKMSLVTLRFKQENIERSYVKHLKSSFEPRSIVAFIVYEVGLLAVFFLADSEVVMLSYAILAAQVASTCGFLLYLVKRMPDRWVVYKSGFLAIYAGLLGCYSYGLSIQHEQYKRAMQVGIDLLHENGTGCGLDHWEIIVNCSRETTQLLIGFESPDFISMRILSAQFGFLVAPVFLPIFSVLACVMYSVSLFVATLVFLANARYCLNARSLLSSMFLVFLALWSIWIISQKDRLIFWIARCEKEFRIAAEDEAMTAKSVVTNLKVEREKIKKLIDKVTDDEYHLNIILSSLHVDSRKVERGDKIGNGALGNIYKGTYHGDQVAIK